MQPKSLKRPFGSLYFTCHDRLVIKYFTSIFNTITIKKAVKEFHDNKLKSCRSYVWFCLLFTGVAIGLWECQGHEQVMTPT